MAKEFAPGIPASREVQKLPGVKAPSTWEFGVHRHEAARAGEHFDLRLGDPESGHAHSWALRTLPKPGERRLAVQQPTHMLSYMDFKGPITAGYGKGNVALARRGKTEVLSADDKHVRFNVYAGKEVEEYALRRMKPESKNWVIQNVTTSRKEGPGQLLPSSKPKYKQVGESKLRIDDPGTELQAKIDGAHVLYQFKSPGSTPRVLSYRPTERETGVIEHTQKMPNFVGLSTPKPLQDTILRGELYAVDDKGKALPAARVSGILNANVWKSRQKQEQEGKLKPVVFDVVRWKGKNVEGAPYAEKKRMLEEAVKEAPWLTTPRTATTLEEKRRLIEDIKTGKEPSTDEGVIEWNYGKAVPSKSKFLQERDVVVRSVFPETGTKRRGTMAGGFEFSYTKNGPIVGRVGTGMSHAMKKDLLQNPSKYEGLTARIKMQRAPEHYAPRAPVFHSFHLDQDIPDDVKTAAVSTALLPHQQRVVERMKQPGQSGLVVAHGLGSGKTLTSIAAQEALGLPSTVVLPASLRANYEKERAKHLTGKAQPADIVSLQGAAGRHQLESAPLLIVDEAHRLRDPATSSYQTVKGAHGHEKRMLLTATPFYNDPSDIAPLVNIAAGQRTLPVGKTDFRHRYVSEEKVKPGLWGRFVRGETAGLRESVNPKTAPELKRVLQQYVDYHPSSKEGYPEVSYEDVQVPMSKAQLKVYDTIIGSAPPWVASKIKSGLPPSKQEAKQLNAFLTGARQVALSTASHAPGAPIESPKIQRAFEDLQQALKENDRAKAVIYSNYLESGLDPMAAKLQAAGVPFGMFRGDMRKAERDKMVQDYNEGKLRALLLSSAGGEGLDLKGTRLMQVLEPHWNLEKLRQVEGRGIRYGSHADLPKEEQNVRVKRYLATRPQNSLLERVGWKEPGMSADEYLQQRSKEKEELAEQFRKLLPGETKTAAFASPEVARRARSAEAYSQMVAAPSAAASVGNRAGWVRDNPDVMRQLRQSPLGAHMGDSALMQNFLRTHEQLGDPTRPYSATLKHLGLGPKQSEMDNMLAMLSAPAAKAPGPRTLPPVNVPAVSHVREVLPKPAAVPRPAARPIGGAVRSMGRKALTLVGKVASVKVAGTDDAGPKDMGFYKGEPASPHTVKFKTEFQGIPINVDRPRGFIMKGKDAKGNEWARRYKYDYGFIPKTLGGDDDGLDVFIGPDKKHPYAYWAVQRKEDGTFDEYKAFLGFPDREAAISAYRQHIPKKYFKGMMTMKVEMMRAMLGLNPNDTSNFGVGFKRKLASSFAASGFFDELQWLVKTSEEEPISLEEKALRGAGTAGLALAARPFGEAGAERLLGAQRIYHGTSRGGAESILRTGLDPAFGGGSTGGSAAMQSPRFLSESEGRIHVATGPLGRRMVASPHAALSGAHEEAGRLGRVLDRAEAEAIFAKGFLGKGKGEIVGGSIPYEGFLEHFEQDPDHMPGVAFRSKKKVGPENLVKGRVGIRSIAKGRSRDLGRYMARHPGRFATGAALMAVPAAAAYGGYQLMRPVVVGEEKTSSVAEIRMEDIVDIPKDLSQPELAKGLQQLSRNTLRARLMRVLQKAEE